MSIIRLAMVQTNPIVGDIDANTESAFELILESAQKGANLIQFGEMAITGYPIEDLATRASFISASEAAVIKLAQRLAEADLGHIPVVIGHPSFAPKPSGWAIAHNSASVLLDGKIAHQYHKHHLPNYSVFDEYRNFVPGNELITFDYLGKRVSIVICEDIWQTGGPVAEIAANETELTLVLNGSPFESDKDDRRLELIRELAMSQRTHVAYTNLVGGQDDLVFDGDSIFVSKDGSVIGRAAQFAEDVLFIDIADSSELISTRSVTRLDDNWQIWNALVLGVRDYVRKNRFKSVVLGLSGGIDSAVCAAIAVDALGAQNVYGVSLPSKYSSGHSLSDAESLAKNTGLQYSTVPIEPYVDQFVSNLELQGLAAENLQARVRALILMANSNTDGHLLLSTGNKTELAVGYSTIYGDAAGGFAPIKDVEKTLVWGLAKYRNDLANKMNETPPIPESSISKPPSAELRENQFDQDTLPDYGVLDEILELHIEKRKSESEIIAEGFDPQTVSSVLKLVSGSEWKRRQGAIGPRITKLAFGRERRFPITRWSK